MISLRKSKKYILLKTKRDINYRNLKLYKNNDFTETFENIKTARIKKIDKLMENIND